MSSTDRKEESEIRNRMKKRLLGILLTACLLAGLLPTVALAAAGDVTYLYCGANGANWQTGTKKAGEYTVVTGSDTTWGDDGNDGWYVVNSNVNIDSRIAVSGTVHLILVDGCTLTVIGWKCQEMCSRETPKI